MKNNDEREFKPIPYIIGASIILIIGGIFLFAEFKIKGTENALINATSATGAETSATTSNEVVADETTVPQTATQKSTEKVTEKITEKTTEPPTEKPTEEKTEKSTDKAEEKEQATEIVIVQVAPTQPPQSIIIYEYGNQSVPNQSVQNQYQYQPPVENVEPATVYVPTYTENDITLSQNVIYVPLNSSSSIEVIFPAGLSSSGVDWSLDNNKVINFSSADFNTVTVVGKSRGTTTVYAKPKGYNVTLQCTVIVS